MMIRGTNFQSVMRHHGKVSWAFLLMASAFLSPRLAQAQSPVADYQFQMSLASTGGTLGPLTEESGGYYSYSTATVNGQSQDVLVVDAGYTGTGAPPTYTGGGVQTPANPFTNGGVYSIVLQASFALNPANVVATKVFDFANLSSDAGLYINDTTGSLQFIDGSSTPVAGGTSVDDEPTGTYFQLALTRTAAGVLTCYVNGTQEFQFTDSTNLAAFGSGDALTVFKDDGMGVGGPAMVEEGTFGDLARLTLFNSVLTPAQLDLLPEPSTWALLGFGGMALLGVTLHRSRACRA
jgi:hypothetical protein